MPYGPHTTDVYSPVKSIAKRESQRFPIANGVASLTRRSRQQSVRVSASNPARGVSTLSGRGPR
jgi:hypothetical protein